MPPYSKQHEWNNYVGDLEIPAVRVRPKSPHELLGLVRTAAANGRRIRGVGSGHSASAVARPERDGTFVELGELVIHDGEGELCPWKWYRGGVDAARLVRVRAGVTIAQLNEALAQKDLALPNMGSYDGQTLAGVVSTATHGSGLDHPPMCDIVRAVELVVDRRDPKTGQRVQRRERLEPVDGPTDAVAYAQFVAQQHGDDVVPLTQSDDAFYSAVVGLGLFGIAYAYTIEVVPAFWLREKRKVAAWDAIQDDVVADARLHREFFDLTIFPHQLPLFHGDIPDWLHGEVLCLWTTRERLDPHPPNPGPKRHDPDGLGLHLAATIFGTDFLEVQANHIYRYQERLVDNFTKKAKVVTESESEKVHRTSLGDDVRATSTEVAVPIEKAWRAVFELLSSAGMNGIRHRYHTSPAGIRFVKASRHNIAPQVGRDSCMVETPLLVGHPHDDKANRVRAEIMRDVRERLEDHCDGRPHWGQTHEMTAAKARRMYSATWHQWLAAVREWNAFGTFSNEISRDLGI